MEFRELENGWKEYKLDELYEFASGLSKGRKEFGFGNPFVTFKDVFYNYFLPDELNELANTTEKEREKCSVKRGDVFLTRTSETSNELGKSSVALKDYPNATFNGFTKRLRPKYEKIIAPEFSGYYFRCRIFRNQIDSMVTMTTRASLNNDTMARLTIIVPPLEEQKAIAKILSDLDEKIESNNKINKNLEEMAQTIFKRWFVDFEFPNEEGKPYKSSGGEMVESELGMIPKCWIVGSLNDIGEVIGGATPSKKKEQYFINGSIPWVTPKDLSNNKDIYISKGALNITEEAFKSTSVKLMPRNTVLFSSRAPIGYIAISKNNITTNQGFKSVVPNREIGISVNYVYCLLNVLKLSIENRASGSTFKEISGGEMKKIECVVPNKYVLEKFSKMTKNLFRKIEINETESRNLVGIKEILLQKLMSGEVRVDYKK